MTVSVPNGVIFNESSMYELQSKIRAYREGPLFDAVKEEINGGIAWDICAIYDAFTVLKVSEFWKDNTSLWEAALHREVMRRQDYNNHFYFDITVYPTPDGILLGTYQCTPAVWGHFIQHSGVTVEAFNSAQSEPEWALIYAESQAPASPKFTGWTITLVDDDAADKIPILKGAVLESMPTEEERLTVLKTLAESMNRSVKPSELHNFLAFDEFDMKREQL